MLQIIHIWQMNQDVRVCALKQNESDEMSHPHKLNDMDRELKNTLYPNIFC